MTKLFKLGLNLMLGVLMTDTAPDTSIELTGCVLDSSFTLSAANRLRS